jgi:hypothetical protein
LILKYGSEK